MSLRGLTGPLPARTGRLLHAQLPPRAVGEQGQQGDKPGQVLPRQAHLLLNRVERIHRHRQERRGKAYPESEVFISKAANE